MILEIFALFFSALFGGMAVATKRNITAKGLGILLTFSGGYLLANTMLHLIPELFVSNTKPLYIGGYLTIGFFLQRFIETFSAGVEHGHSMAPETGHCCTRSHKTLPFLASIALHAILDGTILVHGHSHTNQGLLLGMMLHKFVEAFALMSVLRNFTSSIGRSFVYLVIFSLASPIGLWLSHHVNDYTADSGGFILLAVVTGNFLYISATMLFESNPNHSSNKFTVWISLLGAGVAALMEFLL
ncbi:ZIP family metal transporter [Cardinium endosymbiont of Tipula unca]|uniref:ZIP family metal transporter n=1 Tax=Cardinium endosymbiont of Tipula unca TaxID=3066216 RepID=UPI0030CE9889